MHEYEVELQFSSALLGHPDRTHDERGVVDGNEPTHGTSTGNLLTEDTDTTELIGSPSPSSATAKDQSSSVSFVLLIIGAVIFWGVLVHLHSSAALGHGSCVYIARSYAIQYCCDGCFYSRPWEGSLCPSSPVPASPEVPFSPDSPEGCTLLPQSKLIQ